MSSARSVAIRLRLRQIGRVFLGSSGIGPVVLAWAAIGLVLIAAALVGYVFLMFAVVALAWAGVAMVQAETPSRSSRRLMVASSIVGVVSLAYVSWVLGVRINAPDDGTPEPQLAARVIAGNIGVLVGGLGFIASGAMARRHEQSRREH